MLQGPPGPFFCLLGERLRALGAAVHRINFNGGDRIDWPGEGAVDFRDRFAKWPRFFDHFLRDKGITDVMLFGDCRPMHRAAHGMAKLRDINIHVFEEGYIRPDWVTMELDGVNGHSTLPRDPKWFLEQARTLPPVPELVVTKRLAEQRTKRALARVEGKRYFLFPLQLSSDYQIREHSPFPDMASAVHYVLDSFAHHAPADAMLLIKEHPLDAGTTIWSRFVKREATRQNLADRVVHLAGGDLAYLAKHSVGMVTVNSTSGTFALESRIPVTVLGDAIYDIQGITHQGELDRFWTDPQTPDDATWRSFRQVLHNDCLVRGGFASNTAVSILIESVSRRILS